MSTPLNPLSKFNSYAYHHILVACSNNDVANVLAANNDVTQFDRTSPGGKYSPIPTGNLGEYVVLINGMSDAEFYMDAVSWGSIYVPDGTTASTYDWNSIETDGEIRVTEPGGMRFINVIAQAASDLNIAAPAIVFLLKTIFVGQNTDGTTETIAGVRPVVFTLINLRASFDFTGATYILSIVGGRDGYAKHPGISHVIAGSNLTIKNTQSIGDALDALAEKANTLYQLGKTKGVDQRNTALAEGETYEEGIDFSPLKYSITYDGDFKNHLVATNEIDGTSNNGDSHTVSFQPDLSIQAGITRIIETSKSFMAETATGREHDGRIRKFTFKVTDEVATTKDETFIKYHVNFYELTDTDQGPAIIIGTDVQPPKNHVIEWDYVYTGKNIDIVDFKIELDLALSYFMVLPVAKPLAAGQAETLTASKVDAQPGNANMVEGQGTNTAFSTSGNPKGPMFVGGNAKNQTNKKTSAIETNNARTVMESYAAMSTIGVDLVIHGNPLLIDKVLPPTVTNGPQSLDREKDPEEPTTPTIDPQWEKIPVYCKINIKMPVSSGAPGVYEPFWYQGYYRINKVRNIFEAGEFTQELQIFSLPSATSFRTKASTTGEPISPTATKAPPSTQPDIPRSTESTSDNVPSTLFSEFDDLIVEKALKYNLDPNMMRALVKQESSFNPNAVAGISFNTVPINGTTKAVGLGQIIKSTAIAIAKQLDEAGQLDQPFVINSTRDDRYDPERNMEFSAYLMNQNLAIYKGNQDLALGAYNAGHVIINRFKPNLPPANFVTNDGSVGQTHFYVKKINESIALTEKQIPTIPVVPDGVNLNDLSSRAAFNTFTVGGE